MINIRAPEAEEHKFSPKITVIGVGGAGGNAVNNMIEMKLEGVEFITANTDAQSLSTSKAEKKIQLGENTTKGLGAGCKPDIGKAAAEETIEHIVGEINGSNMIFITAGMGGGTGTGAAPVIAREARNLGILTVGVITKPFQFEGFHRSKIAERGLEELKQNVDTLIIIPNQNLFAVANEKTTLTEAFKMADNVLYSGVKSITDLMVKQGLINLDFADINTAMQNMGMAMMGTGEAEGQGRAIEAAEAAIRNPLLDNTSIKGAKSVLINITGGDDLTLLEVDEATRRINEEIGADSDTRIIFGACRDDNSSGKIRVSVVATGLEDENAQREEPPMNNKPVTSTPIKLNEDKNTEKEFVDIDIFNGANFDKPKIGVDIFQETPKNVANSVINSMPPARNFFSRTTFQEGNTLRKGIAITNYANDEDINYAAQIKKIEEESFIAQSPVEVEDSTEDYIDDLSSFDMKNEEAASQESENKPETGNKMASLFGKVVGIGILGRKKEAEKEVKVEMITKDNNAEDINMNREDYFNANLDEPAYARGSISGLPDFLKER